MFRNGSINQSNNHWIQIPHHKFIASYGNDTEAPGRHACFSCFNAEVVLYWNFLIWTSLFVKINDRNHTHTLLESRWSSGNTLASDTNGPGSTPGCGTLEDDSSFQPFGVGKLSTSFMLGVKSLCTAMEWRIMCRAASGAITSMNGIRHFMPMVCH